MSGERVLEREQENIDMLHARRIAEIRAKLPTGVGPDVCIECENDMPQVRRNYGYTLCVECQEITER